MLVMWGFQQCRVVCSKSDTVHQWFHEIFDYELPNQNSQCTVICFSTVALLCQWGAQYKSRYANVMLSYMICNIFFLPTFVKVETYWEFRWRTKVFVPKPALYIASVTIGKGGPNTYSTQIQWFMYQKWSERYFATIAPLMFLSWLHPNCEKQKNGKAIQ